MNAYNVIGINPETKKAERRSITAKSAFDAEHIAKQHGFSFPVCAPRDVVFSDRWEQWYKDAINLPGYSF